MPGENWKAPKLMPRSGEMRSLKSKADVTRLCNAPSTLGSKWALHPVFCFPSLWSGKTSLGFLVPSLFYAWRNSLQVEDLGGLTLQFLIWSLVLVSTVSLSPLSRAPASAQPRCCPAPSRVMDPVRDIAIWMRSQELHNCTCTFLGSAVLCWKPTVQTMYSDSVWVLQNSHRGTELRELWKHNHSMTITEG